MNHRGQEEKEWTLWGLNPRPHAIYASMQSMRATTVLSAPYHTYYKFYYLSKKLLAIEGTCRLAVAADSQRHCTARRTVLCRSCIIDI